MAKFTADNSYIAISRIAGEKLRRAGVQQDQNASFEDLRKVVISGISKADIDEKSREIHYLVDLNLSGVDVVLHCIARVGSPAKNKPYSVTVFDVMSRQRYDEYKFYENGINLFITGYKYGSLSINNNDISALKYRLRNIQGKNIRSLDNEKAALRKVIDLLDGIFDENKQTIDSGQ